MVRCMPILESMPALETTSNPALMGSCGGHTEDTQVDMAKSKNFIFSPADTIRRIRDTLSRYPQADRVVKEAVICTNQFELYTDFGVQMKARSKAVQTFVVQLANGAAEPQPPVDAPEDVTNDWLYGSSGTYLPSERAVKGGGYGAVIQSNLVGPEGGQMLVEETVKMINAMW